MAIARVNNSTQQIKANFGSTSFSYTVGSGSNRALYVAVGNDQTGDSGSNISPLSYNSVNATNINTRQRSGGLQCVYVFGLLNPSSGANTLAATRSPNTADNAWFVAADYTGVLQSSISSQGLGSGEATATSLSYTVTTVSANSWIFTSYFNNGGTISNGTNFVKLTANDVGGADSNASVGAAGAKTVTLNNSGSNLMWSASTGISPVADPNSGFFMFMPN